MNVYIVEFPAEGRDRDDNVQVFLHSDDQDICAVLSARTQSERSIAIEHIPEPKQREIERWSNYMRQQHTRYGYEYMICRTDKQAPYGIIIRQALKRTDERDAFVEF